MKKFTKFIRFGNIKKKNIDFLIYIPHISDEKKFLKDIRKTSRISLDHISDEMLYRYLRHETDTGTREIAHVLKKKLKKSKFSFAILSVEIPRGFCDLNRPIEKAFPSILDKKFWSKIYNQADKEIEKILQISNFVFHLHSMNNFDSVENFSFDENISEEKILYHLQKVYTGRKREITILTENTHGEYMTNRDFDTILKENFSQKKYTLEENTAYRFAEGYPCTDIARRIPSGFLEFTKGSLSKKKFKNTIDTSKIRFSKKKVKFFAKILAKSFEEYLKKKQ